MKKLALAFVLCACISCKKEDLDLSKSLAKEQIDNVVGSSYKVVDAAVVIASDSSTKEERVRAALSIIPNNSGGSKNSSTKKISNTKIDLVKH